MDQGEFQSLGWVERLSDRGIEPLTSASSSFNPSDGLSVFQTVTDVAFNRGLELFQSLGWVERLSDRQSVW